MFVNPGLKMICLIHYMSKKSLVATFLLHILEKKNMVIMKIIYSRSHPVGIKGLHIGYDPLSDRGRTIAALAGDVLFKSLMRSSL